MSRLVDGLFVMSIAAAVTLAVYRTLIVLGPDACWTSC